MSISHNVAHIERDFDLARVLQAEVLLYRQRPNICESSYHCVASQEIAERSRKNLVIGGPATIFIRKNDVWAARIVIVHQTELYARKRGTLKVVNHISSRAIERSQVLALGESSHLKIENLRIVLKLSLVGDLDSFGLGLYILNPVCSQVKVVKEEELVANRIVEQHAQVCSIYLELRYFEALTGLLYMMYSILIRYTRRGSRHH